MTPLDLVHQRTADLTAADNQLTEIRHRRATAIREARDAGHTLAEIGTAAGCSRQRILQILATA
jgi:DNA-directed RNA polymerase sigma subunit (sigma70/sigma32)